MNQMFKAHFARVRTRLCFLLEIVGGQRVGEVAGGGDGHGALANLCDIDPDVAVGEPFTEELLVELRRVTAATVVCPRVTLGSGDGHTGD